MHYPHTHEVCDGLVGISHYNTMYNLKKRKIEKNPLKQLGYSYYHIFTWPEL